MFGVIALMFIIIYGIYSSISNGITDCQNKQTYKDSSTNTYLDHNGVSRDLTTNKYRHINTDYYGDRHMWGNEIGDVNLSQQQREKDFVQYHNALKEGKNLNRSTIYWEPSPFYQIGKANILGKRYKDIQTGEIYVIRTHKNKDFYVNISTLKVVRYIDFQKQFLLERNLYDENTEIEDVHEFQSFIDYQRNNSSYIGDPTKGIGCVNETRLEDFWKPQKIKY